MHFMGLISWVAFRVMKEATIAHVFDFMVLYPSVLWNLREQHGIILPCVYNYVGSTIDKIRP